MASLDVSSHMKEYPVRPEHVKEVLMLERCKPERGGTAMPSFASGERLRWTEGMAPMIMYGCAVTALAGETVPLLC